MNDVTENTCNLKPNTYLATAKLSTIADHVHDSGSLTRIERHELMAALMDDTLSPEERVAIERLIYIYRRGRLKFPPD
jgi:hypothetical protein